MSALCRPTLALLVAAAFLSAAAQAFQQTASPPVPESKESTDSLRLSPVQSAELDQANSLLKEGKVDEAEHVTRDFLQNHMDSGSGHFLLGFILFREIQLHGIVQGAASSPASSAELKYREERAKASLAEYTEGARHKIPSPYDLKIVSFDYILLEDYADADKWLTRSVQMNPSDSDAWYNLARTKYSENRFEEAIQAFQKCLSLDPNSVKAEDNLGLSYEGLGRKDDAIAAYKKAIEWQDQTGKRSDEPFTNLGSLLLDEDRATDALPYLQQAVTMAPQDAKAHERLGKAYSHLNQLSQAQAELEKAVALTPDVASLHFMLGQVYRREGMMDKAKIEFQRTEELNGTHSSDKSPAS